MFDATITVFNRYTSEELGDTWYPHVLHNVQLIKDKASIKATYGSESSDSAKLFVNAVIDNGQTKIGNLVFYPPKVWSRQVNDEIPASITFDDNAEEFDFFIEGDYGDETPIKDEDYDFGFYNYMNKQYDFCYAITSVGYYNNIPHFEILAR